VIKRRRKCGLARALIDGKCYQTGKSSGRTGIVAAERRRATACGIAGSAEVQKLVGGVKGQEGLAKSDDVEGAAWIQFESRSEGKIGDWQWIGLPRMLGSGDINKSRLQRNSDCSGANDIPRSRADGHISSCFRQDDAVAMHLRDLGIACGP